MSDLSKIYASIKPYHIRLTEGKFIIGTVSNIAVELAITGDMTVNQYGLSKIGNNKITNDHVFGFIANKKLLVNSNTFLFGRGGKGYSMPITGDIKIASDGKVSVIGGKFTGDMILDNSILDSQLMTISTVGKIANTAFTKISTDNIINSIVLRGNTGEFANSTITARLIGETSKNLKLTGGEITGLVRILPQSSEGKTGLILNGSSLHVKQDSSSPAIYIAGTSIESGAIELANNKFYSSNHGNVDIQGNLKVLGTTTGTDIISEGYTNFYNLDTVNMQCTDITAQSLQVSNHAIINALVGTYGHIEVANINYLIYVGGVYVEVPIAGLLRGNLYDLRNSGISMELPGYNYSGIFRDYRDQTINFIDNSSALIDEKTDFSTLSKADIKVGSIYGNTIQTNNSSLIINNAILDASSISTARTYSVPDTKANSEFVMTQGDQKINGNNILYQSTHINNININQNNILSINSSNTLTGSVLNSGQLLIGRTGNTPIANNISRTNNQTTVINNAGQIQLGLAQAINTGVDIKFNSINLTNTLAEQFIIANSKIQANLPSASYTYSVPVIPTSSEFVISVGNQNINGTKTFSSVIIQGISNSGMFIGTSGGNLNTLSLNNGEVLVGVNNNLPTASNLFGTAEQVYITNNSGSIVLSAPQNLDATADIKFNKLINNNIILGTSNITAPNILSSLIYNMPNALASCEFMINIEDQKINSVKTFSSDFYASFLANISLPLTTDANSHLSTDLMSLTGNVENYLHINDGGTNSITPLVNNRIIVSKLGHIVEENKLDNGQLLIGSTSLGIIINNITSSSGYVLINNLGGEIKLNLPQNIHAGANIIFNTVNLSSQLNSNHTQIITNSTNARTYNIPIVSNNSTFIMTEGEQEIYNSREFKNNIILSSLTANKLITLDSKQQIINGYCSLATSVDNTLDIKYGGTNNTGMLGKRLVTSTDTQINEALALTNGQILIGRTGLAPIAGLITAETTQILITNSAGNIKLGTPQNIDSKANIQFNTLILTNKKITMAENLIIATDPILDGRVYNINAVNNSNFVLTESDQKINNGRTFGDILTLTLTDANLPLKLDASNRIITGLIDLELDVANILTAIHGGTGSGTALHNNRFMLSANGKIIESSALTNGQMLIGRTGNTPTASNITETPNQIYVNNTAGGIKLSLAQNMHVNALTAFTSLLLTDTLNQLNFNSLAQISVSDNKATYTVPDITHNTANFVMNMGDQDINGDKKIAGDTKLSGLTANKILTLNSSKELTNNAIPISGNVSGILGIFHGGTNNDVLNSNRIMLSNTTEIIESAALLNGEILIGSTGVSPVNTTLTPTTNETSIINTGGGIQIGLASRLRKTGIPSFDNMTLTASDNQIILGTANLVTLDFKLPTSSSYVYVIPTSVSSNFVMTELDQKINGAKTFTGTINLDLLTNSRVLKLNSTKQVISSANINLGSEVSNILSSTRGGTTSATALTNNRVMLSLNFKIIESDALTNGEILIGKTGDIPSISTLLSSDTTQLLITTSAGSITPRLAPRLRKTGSPSFTNLALTDTFNQLTLGTTNQTIISCTPSASYEVKIPDTQTTTAYFSLTENSGSQIINANRTFTGNWILNNLTASKLIQLSLANKIITAGTYALDSLFDNTLAIIKGGTGSLTTLLNNRIMVSFNNKIIEANELKDGQILIGKTGNMPSIGTLTSSDTTQLLITTSAGSITPRLAPRLRKTGNPSFVNLALTDTSNQLTLGTTNQTIITSTPTTSYEVKIPDTGTATANFSMTENAGSQIINADRTFGGDFIITSLPADKLLEVDTDGKIVPCTTLGLEDDYTGILQITNGGTYSGTALLNNRIMVSSLHKIIEADELKDGEILIGNTGNMPSIGTLTSSDTTQLLITTSAGSITPRLAPRLRKTGSPSFINLALTDTSNQLTLGTTNQTIITSTPTASYEVKISDTGTATANFSMTENDGSQIINADRTFGGDFIITSLPPNKILEVDIDGKIVPCTALGLEDDYTGVLQIAHGGTYSGTALLNNRIMVSSNNKIIEADELKDGEILMGNTGNMPSIGTLTSSDTTQLLITTSAGSITPRLAPRLRKTGSPSFINLALTNTLNQLTLGTTNQTIITSTPTASYEVKIPDTGTTTANFSMTENNESQIINANKTFGGDFIITSLPSSKILEVDIDGKIVPCTTLGLEDDYKGVLQIAHGGTYSGTALLNNRIMVSFNNKIIEADELKDGEILIGNTGNMPSIGTLTSSDTTQLLITTSAGSITPRLAPRLRKIGSPSFVNLALTDTKEQIILGTTQTTTISITPTSSYNIIVPNTGADATFIMTDTLSSQTITGDTKINNTVTLSGLTGSRVLELDAFNQISTPVGGYNVNKFDGILDIIHGGTNSDIALVNNSILVSAYGKIVEVGEFKNGQILIGSTGGMPVISTIDASADEFKITLGLGSITLDMADRLKPTGNPSFADLKLTNNSNQITFGNTNTTILNITATTSSLIYTIPALATNSEFVMTETTQDINGNKNFTGVVNLDNLTAGQFLRTGTSSELVTSSTIDISSETNSYLAVNHGGTNNIILAGDQIIGSVSGQIKERGTLNDGQVFIGLTGAPLANTLTQVNDITTVTNNAGGIEIGLAARLRVTGSPVLASLSLTNTENQFTFGTTGSTSTLSFTTPTTSHTYTLIDAGSDAEFVITTTEQKISGIKTFSGLVNLSNLSNDAALFTDNNSNIVTTGLVDLVNDVTSAYLGIIRGGTNLSTALNNKRILISAGDAVTENSALTDGQIIIGAGTNALVSSSISGTEDIIEINNSSGAIQISLAPRLRVTGNPVFNAINLHGSVLGDLILGTTNTTTITHIAPVGSYVYIIPTSASATFVMTKLDQEINGNKTFSGVVKLNSLTASKNLFLDLADNNKISTSILVDLTADVSGILNVINGGTKTNTIVNNRILVSSTNIITSAPELKNGQLLIGRSNNAPAVNNLTSSDTNQILISNSAGSIVLRLAERLRKTGSPSFNSLILTDDIKQIVLGTTNLTTLNFTTNGSYIYNIPETGIDAKFVFKESNQTINGNKILSGTINFPNLLPNNFLKLDEFKNITAESGSGGVVNLETDVVGILPVANGGTNSDITLLNNRIMVSVENQIIEANALADGELLIGSDGKTPNISTIATSDNTQITVNNSSGSITIGLATRLQKTGSPSLQNMYLTNTNSQLLLGTTNTVGLSFITGSGLYTYNLPNVGSDAYFVMTETTAERTINNNKILAGIMNLDSLTALGILGLDTSNKITTVSSVSLTGYVSGILPIANGGTNNNNIINNRIIISSDNQVTSAVALTDGQLLIGSSNSALVANTIATSDTQQITVSNSAGSITIGLASRLRNTGNANFSSVNITNSTSSLILGTIGATTTIQLASMSSSLSINLPDAGATAQFFMTEGKQTNNSNLEFIGAINLNNLTALGILALDEKNNIITVSSIGLTNYVSGILPVANGGTGNSSITDNQIIISNSNIISNAGVMTNGQLLIGSDNSSPVIAGLTSSDTNQILISDSAGSINVRLASRLRKTGSPSFVSLTLSNASNQLILGTTNLITINATAPSSSLIITIPDVGGTAQFVMTEGNATIGGNKAFSNATILNSLTASKNLSLNSSQQIVSGQQINLTLDVDNVLAIENGGTSNDSLVGNSVMVSNLGIITELGVFDDGKIFIGSAGNLPVIGGIMGTNNQIYVTEGSGSIDLYLSQSINDTSTPEFKNINLTATSQQLILGLVTINASAPSASSIYTINGTINAADFVMTEGKQTVNGDKTLNGTINLNSLTASKLLTLNISNQITTSGLVNLTTTVTGVLGISNGGTNNNSLTNNNLILSSGNKLISTVALNDGQIFIGATGLAPVAGNITQTNNQILVGNDSGNITLSTPQDINTTGNPIFVAGSYSALNLGTIGAITSIVTGTLSTSRTYRMDNIGASANFVTTEGEQTINGNKTFGNTTILSNLVENVLTLDGSKNISNNLVNLTSYATGILAIVNGGTGNSSVVNNRVMYSASNKISSFVELADGELIIGNNGNVPNHTTLTGTIDQVIVTVNLDSITLSTPQNLGISSNLIFNALTLSHTNNQLSFGTTGTLITINATSPTTSRTYTINDTGTTSSFIMTDGVQTLSGDLELKGITNLSGLTASKNLTLNNLSEITNNQISLVNHISNKLGITRGGTNTILLVGKQIIVSSSTTISEVGTMLDGEILICHTGNMPVIASITETKNQISVSNGLGFIGLSTPQNIGLGSSPEFKNLTLTGNSITFGTTNQVIISTTGVASSLTYNIIDTGINNTSFVLTENKNSQIINAHKTFTGTINMSNLTASKLLTLDANNNITTSDTGSLDGVDGKLGFSNGGTNFAGPYTDMALVTINTGAFSSTNAWANGQLLIGFTGAMPVLTELTDTPNQITATSGAGSITLSTPQNLNNTASPTFASMTLSSTNNQLTFGTNGSLTVINAGVGSSSVTYRIIKTTIAPSFVLTEGDQTINNTKTLSGTINLSSLTASQTLYLDSKNNITSPSNSISATADLDGTLGIANGGTGTTTLANNRIILSGSNIITTADALLNGQLLIGSIGIAPSTSNITQTNNQILVGNTAGHITLTTPQSIGISSALTFSLMYLTSTQNQLTVGTTNTITINASEPMASRTYTIPDTLAISSSFVMTNGTQVINGNKTFTGTTVLSSLTATTPLGLNGSKQITSYLYDMSADITNTLPIANGGTNNNSLVGKQLLYYDGSKINELGIMNNGVLAIGSTGNLPVLSTITQTNNQVLVNNTAGHITLSLPQSFGTSSLVSFSTFTDTAVNNQLILGNTSSTYTTISATTPAGSRTISLIDAGVNCSYVMTEGNSIIGGDKSFGGTINLSGLSPNILLGLNGSNEIVAYSINLSVTTDISGTLPVANGGTNNNTIVGKSLLVSSNDGLKINEVTLTNGQLLIGSSGLAPVASTLTQTNNQLLVTNSAGGITLSTPQNINTTSSTSFAKLYLTNSSLILGTTGALTTLNTGVITASRIYTLLDAGTNAQIILSLGDQTLANTKTFNGTVKLSTLSASTPLYLTASKQITAQTIDIALDTTGSVGIANGGTGSGTALNNNSIMISKTGAIVEIGTINNGQIIIGSTGNTPVVSSITGTTNQVNVANNSGSITLSTPQDLGTSSSLSFSAMTLTPLTTYLVLGVTNTTRINSPSSLLASYVYTISDVGNANFLLSESSLGRIINGNKTFTTTLKLSGLTASQPISLDTSGIISSGIPLSNPNSLTGILGIAQGGTNSGTALPINSSRPMVSNGNAIVEYSSALTNGQILIGSTGVMPIASIITQTTNQVLVANGAGSITLSLPQSFGTSSAVAFSKATLTNATNQLAFGSTNKITITSTQAAPRTYTVPNAGTNASFVLSKATSQSIGATTTTLADNKTQLNAWTYTQNTNTFQYTAGNAYGIAFQPTRNIFVKQYSLTIRAQNGNTQTFHIRFYSGSGITATNLIYDTLYDVGIQSYTGIGGASIITNSINGPYLAAGATYTMSIYFVTTTGSGPQRLLSGLTTASPVSFNTGGIAMYTVFNGYDTVQDIGTLYYTGSSQFSRLQKFKVSGLAPSSHNLGNGSVTQTTSITTAVTLNGNSGKITTLTFTTAANTIQATGFVVNNSAVSATSVIRICTNDYSGTYGTNGMPFARVTARTAGSFTIRVGNSHNTNALNGTLVINFMIS